MDRQENPTIQLDNTREMGRVLSEHNQESRNVRSNDTSIATNTNGISNLGEQRSRQEERTGLTDMEILAEEQINLNQYIAIEPQIYSPLFQEMMMKDKEQMLQEATINNQYWKLQQEMMDMKEEASNLGKN